jgi:hypothetical protein
MRLRGARSNPFQRWFPHKAVSLLYMLLVFGHLLAASMALGAIVATDLRLLSKLSQDKVRIAPPNPFVARIVMLALLLLCVTGGGIVWHGLGERADFLDNPKLQVKIGLVVLLTLNAFMLHYVTFPRLARGRRVARWHLTDWILVAVPVATSNFLWMFIAFLGVARPWNYSMPMRDILEIAAALYLVVQLGVFTILAMAGRKVQADSRTWTDRLARSLAAVGSLGRAEVTVESSRSSSSSSRRRRSAEETAIVSQPAASSVPVASEPPLEVARPNLRLVGSRGHARRSAR